MTRGGWIAIAIGIAVAVSVAYSQRGDPPPGPTNSEAPRELPSGAVVLVANGYQAPQDRVES